MRRFFFIFILFVHFPLILSAQWSRLVVDYDMRQHEFGTHTWQISAIDAHWVYFANNSGVFQYSAQKWQKLPSPKHSQIRAILPLKEAGRIYLGGAREFGYYNCAPNGEMNYVSLSDSLSANKKIEFEQNIWNIIENDNVIYFQADHRIIKYVDEELFVIDIDEKINTAQIIDGILYLGTDDGLKMLIGNVAFRKNGSEILDGKVVRAIKPFRDEILIATNEALYLYDGERVRPFICVESQQFFMDNSIFSLDVDADRIAVGTILGGVLVYDTRSGEKQFFERSSGLKSNTVLSLEFVDDRLWVGQDGGISSIILDSPLEDLRHNNLLGAGYDAYAKGDFIYLATNGGLHFINKNNDFKKRPQLFANAKGQAWALESIGEDLFSLQDLGLFNIKGDKAHKIGDIRGAWSFAPIPGDDNRAIVGTYSELYLIEKLNGTWQLICQLEGYSGMAYRIAFVDEGTLFVYNEWSLESLSLSSDFKKIISREKLFDKKSSLGLFGKQRDTVYLELNGSMKYFDKIKGGFEDYIKYSSLDTLSMSKLRIVENGKSSVIVTNNNRLNVLDENKRLSSFSLNDNLRLTESSKMVVPLDDSLVVLTHQGGFSRLNIKGLKNTAAASQVLISSVFCCSGQDSLLYCRNFAGLKAPNIVLDYSRNSLRFELAISSNNADLGALFQYRLTRNGADEDWSSWSSLSSREFLGLDGGDYVFSARALAIDGSQSETEYRFTILPPWYLTWWSYIIYGIFVVLCVGLIVLLVKMNNRRKRALLIKQKDEEIEEQQKLFDVERQNQQAKILALEKQRIEMELKQKSLEVANMMVSSTNKSSIFTKIKEELVVLRQNVNRLSKEDLIAKLTEIDSRMDAQLASEDTLKRIESEFDLVHDSFMRVLDEKHPVLSHSERMMCAYLKVGLSTKEIAPLLNISTRGVETLRYRIRKKFSLTRDDSLKAYLDEILKLTQDVEL